MKTEKLKKIVKRIFIKHGLSNKHAEISSSYIIKAELVGAPSHGLARLKMYCNRIKKKLINSKPKIKIKKISQSISHVDGNDAIGFVAADIGIKIAIDNAKKTGFGMVGIKNSGHYYAVESNTLAPRLLFRISKCRKANSGIFTRWIDQIF